MKNFLAQEHEKLSLWWAAISAKEITAHQSESFSCSCARKFFIGISLSGMSYFY